MSALIIFVTVPNRRAANRLARALVKERLAACVSLVPKVESYYRWKGKMERSSELLLLIKTTSRRYPTLQKRIRTLHSYTVPEILALPVVRGNPEYLAWLEAAVQL